MCEYCEKGKLVKSCNFCGSAKMRILEGKEFNTLDIWGDEKKFNIFNITRGKRNFSKNKFNCK